MPQKILMVDDDAQVASVLHTALETLGHQVSVCTDALKAEEVAKDFQPNLVLLDLMMPGKSGLELVGPISAQCPNSIVCLVTGMSDSNVLRDSMKAGAWSVLYKPYSLSDLSDLIALAEQLSTAIQNETKVTMDTVSLNFKWNGNENFDPDAISAVIQFAELHGADPDVATRKLPLIAVKLLSNALTHGTAKDSTKTYGMDLKEKESDLCLTVYHDGEPFNWKRELTRLSISSGSGKATGLQLVQELSDKLDFEDSGRRANVCLQKNKSNNDSSPNARR